MEGVMRVALCQLDIAWEDKKVNMEQARIYIQEAKAEQANIIFFPEMSFTGFSMNISVTKEKNRETVNEIRELAVENQIAIGVGWVKSEETWDGREAIENHYTMLGGGGEILSDYVKLHPFSFAGEEKIFTPGNRLAFFEYQGRMFSTFLCYDLRFPEIFSIASEKADLIVIPASWPQKRKEQWITLLRARAIENQVYMLGVNCIGEKDGLYYSGDSCIIAPNGNVMESLSDQEGLIISDIPDNIKQIREEFPVRKDRRPELYQKLAKDR